MASAVVRTVNSRGRVLTRLLADEVLGVPHRPILIALAAGPLLVLAVRGLRPPQRRGEVRRRSEGRGVSLNATGRSVGHLLEQPAVAVRIVERGERAVAAMLRVGPPTRRRRNR